MSRLLNRIVMIISESGEFFVPLFAKAEVLQEILLDEKDCLEAQFESLTPEFFPNEEVLYDLWGDAIADTEDDYLTESEKRKISDLYIQELIMRYAEKIGVFIVEQSERFSESPMIENSI